MAHGKKILFRKKPIDNDIQSTSVDKIETGQSELRKTPKPTLVPHVISFGAGVPKAFKTTSNIRQPWHSRNSKSNQKKTDVLIDIDMQDLMDVLN